MHWLKYVRLNRKDRLKNMCASRRQRGLHCAICNVIETNNELEVFVQISTTDVGFGNNRGLRPRLLQNPNEVFDICTNTSNKLFISILL